MEEEIELNDLNPQKPSQSKEEEEEEKGNFEDSITTIGRSDLDEEVDSTEETSHSPAWRRVKGFEIPLFMWSSKSGKDNFRRKKVFLITHGFGEYGERYTSISDYFVESVRKSGCDVYCWNMRNHFNFRKEGKAGTQNNKNIVIDLHGGFDVYVEQFLRVLEYFLEKERKLEIYLFGHSMGSCVLRNVDWEVLREGPNFKRIKGLILSGSGIYPGGKFTSILMSKVVPVVHALQCVDFYSRPVPCIPFWVLKRMKILNPIRGNLLVTDGTILADKDKDYFVRPTLRQYIYFCDANKSYGKQKEQLKFLSSHGVPVLMFGGTDDDVYTGLEKFINDEMNIVPNFKGYLIEGGKHEILNERDYHEGKKRIIDDILYLIKNNKHSQF